ncbi:MAG: hypothetical protein M5U01_38735 [Ardenticatenaceae bacterium]|nr:hypothetical protein [Ardenticatenaceae bacterium]HBY98720.1 AAA family ATPase [Chloroflexota bacterium]
MGLRLADRLSAARHRRFVGRETEITRFRTVLTAAELPFPVLYIFGPGGVGKTTLLAEFVALCAQTQTPAISIDARNIEPAPDAFLNVLTSAMGLVPGESPVQALAAASRRHVILLDTFETLAPLDSWIRDIFLPQLPENTLVVLAGRQPPSTAWRADPGWQSLVYTLSLRNLSPEESRSYLLKREIPLEQHQGVLDFTHGHPLALSLVADVFAQRHGFRFEPEATPDVIKVLVERFIQKVPSPAHRAALEICALVRLTTEGLLSEMLMMPDAHELFEWLRELSFIEAGRLGLFPHDLARETLIADMRWRNPDWYAELHRRARTYYLERLQQTQGQEQQRILSDYIFLHRDNPVVRPYFEWQGSSGALADTLRPGDEPALLRMVAQHEGEGSARLAAHWIARQPGGVSVFRQGLQPPAGLLVMVGLQQATAEELNNDPATQAAWHYLRRHAPLRPGESATLFRFWMAHDTYQAVSSIQSLIFVNMVRHYLTTPGLAFTFLPCAEPDFWAPVFAYADLARIREADFQVEGRHYGVYGHDWRAVPPMAWLSLLAEREIATTPLAVPSPSIAEPLVVLSQPEFASAVRDTLRDLFHPEALRGNPLLRSRLVVDRVGANADEARRVAALQGMVKEAVESLQQSPREAKLYRALYHTYLQPAATQEQAAELLDLPFSTFRRHLKSGITQVVEILWQQELGGSEK